MNIRLFALLVVWVVPFGCGGCRFLFTGGSAGDGTRRLGVSDSDPARSGPAITSTELDELTQAFADRYVGLLASACDALKKDNPNPVQRREAQDLLVNCATNIYDIASNTDSFTRLLDLVVVTTLVSQVWIDDDRAAEVFADRADVLVRALHQGRVEAWALAAQVLRPDQLDLMDYMLWDWRRHNPDMVQASFVRLSSFAGARGMSANSEVLAAFGFLDNVESLLGGGFLAVFLGRDPAQVGQAARSVDEVRLLSERAFYMLKRAPTLLRWQVEAMKDDAVATPEIGRTLTEVQRLNEQVEQLPKQVAAERQAILAAFDERKQKLDETIALVRGTVADVRGAINDVKGAMTDANKVATSVTEAGDALNEMLKTADILVGRFDTGAASPAAQTSQPSRPFDIRDYTDAVKELAVTASIVNDILKSSTELLESSAWNCRIQQVNEAADERVRRAAEQSQLVVNNFFWRAYVALGIVFVILSICLATAFVLMRRLIIRLGTNAAALRPGSDHAASQAANPGSSRRDGRAE